MTQPLSPVLIVGGRSDMARALARAYAEAGCEIILAARRSTELRDDCSDITIRYGVAARAVELNVVTDDADRFFQDLGAEPGTVVMVVGLLGDQAAAVRDDALAEAIMASNYVGPARFLLAAARVLRRQGAAIIGISSVAGDRGRGSNLVYGSAKAGFTAFLSGLRNQLAKHGIHVMTVKPGFVATRMTAGMDLPKPLTALPEEVAARVLTAHRRGRNEIYVKPVWRPIMRLIREIPEPLFKRMKL